jgi:tRNA threonylcarbamoyladenosine biosynthesis protein TsaB
LAIDTATETLAVGLQVGPHTITHTVQRGLKHAETLVPCIERLCSDFDVRVSELDYIAASVGPGSFTGIRIGLATAKGLAYGSSCPLHGVSTLDAIAWRFRSFDAWTIPVIDARKKRLYTALYEKGHRQSEYLDISSSELVELIEKKAIGSSIILTGPFARELSDSLEGRINFTLDPKGDMIDPLCHIEIADAMHSQGVFDDVLPLYLRRSEAEIKRNGEKNE